MGSSKTIITAGILLVTLAVPALLFVFLHTFGENEFVIPIYYQEGIPASRDGCSWPDGQFKVPNFELYGKGNEKISNEILNEKISIVYFEQIGDSMGSQQLSLDLIRVVTAFKESPMVQLLSISAASTILPSPPHGIADNLLLLSGAPETIADLASCGFILPPPDPPDIAKEPQLILVDGQKRIRGYFDGRTKDEIDRLITEIEILKLEPYYEQK